jgi:hypothetical protein
MAATNYKFQGWVGKAKDADKGKMVWEGYTPKKWTENDVDIKISHCGICGSGESRLLLLCKLADALRSAHSSIWLGANR